MMVITKPTRVLLVGDDSYIDNLYRELLDHPSIYVVAVAESCDAAADYAAALQPAVAIVDLGLHTDDAITTAVTIRNVAPRTQVILLSDSSNRQIAISAMKAGCMGVIAKRMAVDKLVSGIRFAGQTPEESAALLSRLHDNADGAESEKVNCHLH